jgi:hypothetical protein
VSRRLGVLQPPQTRNLELIELNRPVQCMDVDLARIGVDERVIKDGACGTSTEQLVTIMAVIHEDDARRESSISPGVTSNPGR